jgi:hypothetical protein
MFSTLFYIFILFYDGLYSVSSQEYNLQISQLNHQIASKEYSKALDKAHSIQQSSIFVNLEIEKIVAVLELKIHFRNKNANHIALSDNSIANDILYSHLQAQNGGSKQGLLDLKQSIIKNGNVDTLVKSYELYSFNFPQNIVKKQSSSAQMINKVQKINTQEALSLLNLMKKKQKNLIY